MRSEIWLLLVALILVLVANMVSDATFRMIFYVLAAIVAIYAVFHLIGVA